MRDQLIRAGLVYVFLLLAVAGNLVFFAVNIHSDDPAALIGFIPTLLFALVVSSAGLALVNEKRAASPAIKKHASDQLRLIMLLVVGGIFSSVQASTWWWVNSAPLAAAVNNGIIVLIIYVLGQLVAGLVSLRHHGPELADEGRGATDSAGPTGDSTAAASNATPAGARPGAAEAE